LIEKSRDNTVADFEKLEWPDPPKEPTCPLQMLEEATLKALDEVEDLKEKLVTQDKEISQMKAKQLRVFSDLSALEEKGLKLKKAIEDKGKVANSLISKELASKPDMLRKGNGVEIVDPSGLQGEVSEGPVQSDEKKGLKQNMNSNTYFSASPVSPPLQVNSLVGVPMYQHSTQNYGYQPVLHSSPYFCKCLCVFVITIPVMKCKMLKRVNFLDILATH
jgi:hypothetical protein